MYFEVLRGTLMYFYVSLGTPGYFAALLGIVQVIFGTCVYFQALCRTFRYFLVLLGTLMYFEVFLGTLKYFYFPTVPVAKCSTNSDLLAVHSCSPCSPNHTRISITQQFHSLDIASTELFELVLIYLFCKAPGLRSMLPPRGND